MSRKLETGFRSSRPMQVKSTLKSTSKNELNPEKRYKFRARDPLNNLLNLGYEVLKREIILAMVPMHLDPYLGFLHSYFRFKPSLV
jgi:CRISPR/Cas system-associated endonuclease Cas1